MTFHRLVSVIGIAASVAVLLTALRLDPDPRGIGTHEQLGLPPCGFHFEHGVPCISCGMTTAFVAMAHLQPASALRANPFGCLLFLVTLAAPFYLLHSFVTGQDPFRILHHRRATLILPLGALLLLANWGVMVLLARR